MHDVYDHHDENPNAYMHVHVQRKVNWEKKLNVCNKQIFKNWFTIQVFKNSVRSEKQR